MLIDDVSQKPLSSSDSLFESSSPADKSLSNSLEVEGCCESGIWRCGVSSFEISMSESSPLLISFSNNFRFLLIVFLSLVFLSHEEDRLLLRSKSPTREHKSVIPR